MMRMIVTGIIIPITLITQITVQTSAQSPATKLSVLTRVSGIPARNDFAIIAAKIRLGLDTADAYRHLDTLLARAYGDMFWMYGCAGLFYATQDVLRPEYKARIRSAWKHNTPYRGDTENHFLMYYGSLLLMSQAWPDLADTEWFMGKSSRAIYAESKAYLDHWIDETTRFGTTEWSSPRYGYYYITPLLLLAEYTKDARLKRRFTMMLEYILADYASDYLNGSYCGTHSRVGDDAALDPRKAEINSYGQYFFEDSVTHLLPDVAFATMTKFTCPKIIRQIATDRTEPYEQFSLKRGRQMIRYMDEWSKSDATHDSTFHAPVYKYEYMTKDYCLGSMQGGIVQPIQQQSWSLVFNSAKPNNIITGLHPYVSADELGMFFPEYPSFMLERIEQVKKGYTSEDKSYGGSPYERIYQDKNVLVALYDLPDSVKYHEYDLFIPTDFVGSSLEDEGKPGWINITDWKHYVWVYMLSPYEIIQEEHGKRFRSKASHGGYVVWCQPPKWFDVDEGCYDSVVVANDKVELLCSKARNRTLMKLSKIENKNWLFHSPFLESKKGSGVLTIRYKGKTRVLDFTK
ncbi:MAG: hypothetical protein Q8922_10780 [Bacteroidota bacterium]|nr:hypothetical protein [Bacteroidota bacterium]MDP4232668.1 hypothetical protein [Bacteroidota bacterium]MDP4243199.1 hypothetical protein [Bacteroidota bacterium]MDP4288411.1 hypothetical protein [Bacteroidota bacterium]